MDPQSKRKYLTAIDEAVLLLAAERTIKDGGLDERLDVIKKPIPWGSRLHAVKRIESVRGRSARSSYPRGPAGRKKRINNTTQSSQVADAQTSGAAVGRMPRTEALKREITRSTNDRLASDITCATDEEVAERILQVLKKRNSSEDPQVSLRRIALIAERKLAALPPEIDERGAA